MDKTLQDNLRAKTENTPISRNGGGWHIHRLDFNVNGRISLVPTGHGWILLMILMDFAIFPVHVLMAGIPDATWLIMGVIVFSVPIFFMAIRYLLKWRTSIDPSVDEVICRGQHFPLSSVKALQVLQRTAKSKKDFDCWELNFVLADATRINVSSSGNKRRFDQEVVQLSKALRLPVWGKDGDWQPDDEAALSHNEKGDWGELFIGIFFTTLALVILFKEVVLPVSNAMSSGDLQLCPKSIGFPILTMFPFLCVGCVILCGRLKAMFCRASKKNPYR